MFVCNVMSLSRVDSPSHAELIHLHVLVLIETKHRVITESPSSQSGFRTSVFVAVILV